MAFWMFERSEFPCDYGLRTSTGKATVQGGESSVAAAGPREAVILSALSLLGRGCSDGRAAAFEASAMTVVLLLHVDSVRVATATQIVVVGGASLTACLPPPLCYVIVDIIP